MSLLLQLLWLAAPILLTGTVHLVVIKRDWLPALRRIALDGGARFRGRRVFGDNKTLRGAVVMIGGSALCSVLLARLTSDWASPIEFAAVHPAAWGALVGTGYIVGELPNSFVKRQIGIAPGAMDSGLRGRLFWIVDQLDSLVGVLAFVAPVWQPSLSLVIASTFVMLALHPLSAWVMMLAGLKDRVG